MNTKVFAACGLGKQGMALPANLGRKINAIRFQWERGASSWSDTLGKLRNYVSETEALELLRTWAAAVGREVES